MIRPLTYDGGVSGELAQMLEGSLPIQFLIAALVDATDFYSIWIQILL